MLLSIQRQCAAQKSIADSPSQTDIRPVLIRPFFLGIPDLFALIYSP
jgi:hypothetical protein